MRAIIKFSNSQSIDFTAFNTAEEVIENALSGSSIGTVVYNIPSHSGFEVEIDADGSSIDEIPCEIQDCFESALMTLSENFGIDMKISGVKVV